MEHSTKAQISELQTVISNLPLNACFSMVLPEFGVQWRDLSRAVRNHRLPMQPASVARVLCKHAAKSLPGEEVAEIIARLRVKLLAVQNRKWHVVTLLDPLDDDVTMEQRVYDLPTAVTRFAKKSKPGTRLEVESAAVDDLLYISVRKVSATRKSSYLYVASPPGLPVALVSSTSSPLLKACVQALGYESYEDAYLCGHDIPSLLAIHNRQVDENPDHLTEIPQYNPAPEVTATGIDFTYRNYDEKYVDMLLGPNPPLLTQMDITSSKPFFDPTRLKKKITISVQLRSENVAMTLKHWVAKKALAPTSEFFHIFNKLKSNRLTYEEE